MIQLGNASVGGYPSIYGLYMSLYGDGAATTFVTDMSASPWPPMDFSSNVPLSYVINNLTVTVAGVVDPTYTAIVTFHRNLTTVTFNKPLPVAANILDNNNFASIAIQLGFRGF